MASDSSSVFGLLAFIAVRVVILFDLTPLSPWAWKAGVARYSLATVVDLLRAEVRGLLVSLLVAGFSYSQKGLCRRS